MTNTVYILVAMIFPLIVIGLSIPIFMWRIRSKNEAFARNHVQVCVLSDTVDKKYYQCEEPQNGALVIIVKKDADDGTKEIKGKEFLAMNSHPGTYPPAGFRQIRAPISEYYVTDSFVPLSLKTIDPLETASALFRLEHEGVTAVVVRQAHADAEKDKKSVPGGMKQNLQFLMLGVLVSIVVGGVGVYLIMKGNDSINSILEGLRALGVIR